MPNVIQLPPPSRRKPPPTANVQPSTTHRSRVYVNVPLHNVPSPVSAFVTTTINQLPRFAAASFAAMQHFLDATRARPASSCANPLPHLRFDHLRRYLTGGAGDPYHTGAPLRVFYTHEGYEGTAAICAALRAHVVAHLLLPPYFGLHNPPAARLLLFSPYVRAQAGVIVEGKHTVDHWRNHCDDEDYCMRWPTPSFAIRPSRGRGRSSTRARRRATP
jgi:hypothetical protein